MGPALASLRGFVIPPLPEREIDVQFWLRHRGAAFQSFPYLISIAICALAASGLSP
jgi:hypothetical protein